MSALALAREHPAVGRRGEVHDFLLSLRGGPTLDDVVSSAWEGLTAHGSATCLVCGDTLAPPGAASGSQGGGCRSCGSHLS